MRECRFSFSLYFCFFNDTATTEIYTLSLHDALPISNKIPFTKRYLIIPVAKIINYIFTGLRLTDVHNGMRAFKSSVAGRLYLTQDRMAHASEYPYLVKKNNLTYLEVPVKIIYHQYGQGINGGLKILKELLTEKILRI